MTTNNRKTTGQRRSDFKAEISRALRTALHHCDMTQADLADECGVSSTLVGKWLDPNREETPSLADLAMFRPELAQAMYPLLTRSHGVTLVKRVAADATTADHFVRFSELATHTATVTNEYATALSDGHVDLVEEKRPLFTAHAGDLAWAVGEIERLTADRDTWKRVYNEACDMLDRAYAECGSHSMPVVVVEGAEILAYTRAEIARLDALSRATADDVEDAVPCLPCGRVECSCGDATDEECQ